MRTNLANTFESLLEEHQFQENFDSRSFEDIDLEDALDIALEALGNKSHVLAALEKEIDTLETMDVDSDFSFESLSEDVQELLTDSSMEAMGLESISMEEKVGGVSNILQRLWQVYFLDFLTTFNWVVDLIKSSKGRLDKYSKQLDDVKRRFDKKRSLLDQQSQKASYVKLWNYWMNEDGFIKKPFDQLKKEEEITKYVMFDYPKVIEKEIDNLITIAKRADFESAESFQKTVADPLERRKHPVKLFEPKYLGGRPFMLHTGLRLSGKNKDTGSVIGNLGLQRKVVLSKRLLVTTANGLIPHVIPDVEMSNREIDALIARGEDFVKLTEKFLKETDQMERKIGAMEAAFKTMMASAKDSGNKSVEKNVRTLGRYSRSLVDCYWSPSVKMSKRTIDLVKGIVYLSGRLVAYAK